MTGPYAVMKRATTSCTGELAAVITYLPTYPSIHLPNYLLSIHPTTYLPSYLPIHCLTYSSTIAGYRHDFNSGESVWA
jgi:hypothetical protein